MRIKQLQLLIAPDDVIPFLSAYLPLDRLTDLRATTGVGLLHVSCRYRFGPLPIPVELTVRIAEVRPEALVLHVTASNAMVQEALLGLLRSGRVDFLQADGSRLQILVDRLTPYVRARFRLSQAAFTPEGIQLAVTDLTPARRGASR